MLRTRVSSSDLQSVGYDATICTLEIKFLTTKRLFYIYIDLYPVSARGSSAYHR
jgi:hypothetical protein